MPPELIAIAPRTPALRAYDEPPLGAGQIRTRSEFASPKHGTERVADRRIADGIVTPIVPFTDAVDTYRAIDERPQKSIKLGIVFP